MSSGAFWPSLHTSRMRQLHGYARCCCPLCGLAKTWDFGVIAERDRTIVGAAWARQYLPSENPVFYAGPRIPEISIGVVVGEWGLRVSASASSIALKPWRRISALMASVSMCPTPTRHCVSTAQAVGWSKVRRSETAHAVFLSEWSTLRT